MFLKRIFLLLSALLSLTLDCLSLGDTTFPIERESADSIGLARRNPPGSLFDRNPLINLRNARDPDIFIQPPTPTVRTELVPMIGLKGEVHRRPVCPN